MKLNKKEAKIISIVIAVWGLVLIGSGCIMSSNNNTITKTNYKLNVSKEKLSVAQTKINEIKLKSIEIEINTPLSLNVKDYLINPETISDDMIKELKLDTSLVNVSEAGTYKYTVQYKKKKYQETITVKEKALPDVKFTLKDIQLYVGDAIPTDVKQYINEQMSDEVYKNLTLDLSEVNNSIQNNYKYYVTYNNTRYEGTITVRERLILPSTTVHSCPSDIAKYDTDSKACKCIDENKTYDSTTRTCK